MFSGANFDPEFMSQPSDDSDDDSENKDNDVVATNVKEHGAAKSRGRSGPSSGKSTPKAASSNISGGAGRGRGRGRGRGGGGKRNY